MLNTKEIKAGGTGATPKTLQPGNQKIMIHKVELEEFRYKPGALNLMLHAEGEPIEEDGYEGWWIDKDNHALGKAKGQVGRIRSSEYAYSDGTTKSGIAVSRDADILKIMKNLCIELGCLDWLEAQNEKHATVESLVETFSKDQPFKGKWLNICLAGKEYTNKEGYPNYDLFLPKYSKSGAPFQDAKASPSKVAPFDTTIHIKKKAVTDVENFDSAEGTPAVNSDFKL